MKFKRYSWKVKMEKARHRKLFKTTPTIGFRLNLFFQSNNGMRLVLKSDVLKLDKIKSKKIDETIKTGFLKKKTTYTPEFIEEILKKNKKLIHLKEVEIVGF